MQLAVLCHENTVNSFHRVQKTYAILQSHAKTSRTESVSIYRLLRNDRYLYQTILPGVTGLRVQKMMIVDAVLLVVNIIEFF